MAGAVETGKAFISELMSVIPADQQAAVRAALEADAVATKLGESVLGRSDNTRQAQELEEQRQRLDAERQTLQGWRQNLTAWAATKEQEFKARGNAQPTPKVEEPKKEEPKVADPNQPKYLTQEELDQRERGYTAFMVDQNTLQREHFSKFGEILDLHALVTHPEFHKLGGLRGTYEAIHGDALKKHADEAEAKRVEAIEKAAVEKYRASMTAQGNNLPFPTTDDTSPLAALGSKENYGADAAVAFYRERQAAGVGR